MGTGRMSSDDWTSYATTTFGSADRSTLRSKSTASMFSARSLDPTLDPAKVSATVTGTREARDNEDNPESTAIMLFTDVTGSMGFTSQEVLTGMEIVCTELYDRKPVTDPAILTGAVGDAFFDTAPLQVGQFESDIRIVDGTRKLYIEGGGGGNNGESYALAWLFAAQLTSVDCYEKRGKKGFLFTVGDEPLLGAEGLAKSPYRGTGIAVTKEQAKKFLDLDLEADLSAEDCYAMASEKWEIFHICVNRSYEPAVKASFGAVLGDRLLWLQDTAVLPELIVSAIQVVAGEDKATVAASWDGSTNVAIADAIKDLVCADGGGSSGGVARL